MRLAKNIFFLCFIILPSLAHAQTWRFFAELHYSTMLQFNYIEPGKTLTKKEINEYYAELLGSCSSMPIKVGVEYKKHHLSVFRQSNSYLINGYWHHIYHDPKQSSFIGGGFDFLYSDYISGIKYGYFVVEKNKFQLLTTFSFSMFSRRNRYIPNSNAWKRVGNNKNDEVTLYKYWDNDSFFNKGFRPIIGLEGQYNITKRKSIGINLQYHFPTSQKVFQRDITVIDRKTGEHHNFQHVNYGRALDISVFFKYNFAEIKSFKTIRDPLGSRQKYKG